MERLINLHQRPYSWSEVEVGNKTEFLPGEQLTFFYLPDYHSLWNFGKEHNECSKESPEKGLLLASQCSKRVFCFPRKSSSTFLLCLMFCQELVWKWPCWGKKEEWRGSEVRTAIGGFPFLSFFFCLLLHSNLRRHCSLEGTWSRRKKRLRYPSNRTVPMQAAEKRTSGSQFPTRQHL